MSTTTNEDKATFTRRDRRLSTKKELSNFVANTLSKSTGTVGHILDTTSNLMEIASIETSTLVADSKRSKHKEDLEASIEDIQDLVTNYGYNADDGKTKIKTLTDAYMERVLAGKF